MPSHRSSLEDLELALELELNGALEPIPNANAVEVDRERRMMVAEGAALLQGTTMQEASCCLCRAMSSHLYGTRGRGRRGTRVLVEGEARLQTVAAVAGRVRAQTPTPSRSDECQEPAAGAAVVEKRQARRWPSLTS